LIVVRADQAPTSSLEQENARGSKFSSTTAFFDSIGSNSEVRMLHREVGFALDTVAKVFGQTKSFWSC
jgi:hypothetical protein